MDNIGVVIPLWIFLALSVVVLAASLRALLVERREGLPPSHRRVIVAAVAVLVVGACAARATFVRGDAPTVIKPAIIERGAFIAHKKATLEEVRLQTKQLETDIASLEAGGPMPPPLPEVTVPGKQPDLTWPMTISALALLAAFGFLLFGGDPTTLIPAAWRRRRPTSPEAAKVEDDTLGALDQLAAFAAADRFEEGLAAARKVREELLDAIDELDLLFLRGLCAVQLASKATGDARKQLLDGALKDLALLLQRAPQNAQGEYLLALARGLAGEFQPALDGFRAVAPRLGSVKGLPFPQNESVCLLSLAEQRLAQNDTDGANRLFEEATKIGVLKDRIPVVLVENRLLNVRRCVSEGKLAEARSGLELVRSVEGLPEDQAKAARIVCDAFAILVVYREGQDQRTVTEVRAFLERLLPKGLPDVEESAADEYLEAVVRPDELPLPVELYRALFFLEAVARLRLLLRRGQGTSLGAAEVDELTQPLLRALQFEPRHREVLASLGGLHYWFAAGKRAKALEWVESAVAMGAKSRIARKLLERDRLLESERKQLLDRFLGTSARFLADPAVSAQVRRALGDELGRFQEFQPLLLELEQSFDAPPQSPTLRSLRERARYLDGLTGEAAGQQGAGPRLTEVRKEYLRLVETLEGASERIAELDKRVLEEVGRMVFGSQPGSA